MSDPYGCGAQGPRPDWYGQPSAYGQPGYGYPQQGGQPLSHPLYGAFPPTGPVYLPPEASVHDAYWDGTRPIRVLAGPGRRLGARMLDGVITAVGFYLILLLFVGIAVAMDYDEERPGPVAIFFMILGGLLALAFAFMYESMSTYRWGATVGKMAAGIRVVRVEDGWQWPPAGRSFWRNVVPALLGLTLIGSLLDSLWLLWDRPRYECLHDKAARTVVVRKEGMPER
jgi:uncharacterized RDD family membrane protein YckC